MTSYKSFVFIVFLLISCGGDTNSVSSDLETSKSSDIDTQDSDDKQYTLEDIMAMGLDEATESQYIEQYLDDSSLDEYDQGSDEQIQEENSYEAQGCEFFDGRVQVKFRVLTTSKYPYYRVGWQYDKTSWHNTILERVKNREVTSTRESVKPWYDEKDRLRITFSVVPSYDGENFHWGKKKIMIPMVRSCQDQEAYVITVKANDE